MKVRTKIASALGFLGTSVAAFAEGTSQVATTYTIPTDVSNAILQLQDAGTKMASSILPMVIGVALAFAGVGLALVAIRWFTRGRNAGK